MDRRRAAGALLALAACIATTTAGESINKFYNDFDTWLSLMTMDRKMQTYTYSA